MTTVAIAYHGSLPSIDVAYGEPEWPTTVRLESGGPHALIDDGYLDEFYDAAPEGDWTVLPVCGTCGGSGYWPPGAGDSPCESCAGTGLA